MLTPPLLASSSSHVFQAPLPLLRDEIVKGVEQIVTTPLQKNVSESMRNLSSKKCREQEYLKLNQGSMPNLHEIASINSIENNRYYSQIAASQSTLTNARMSTATPQLINNNHYDSCFMLFKETEIRAQSSCANLHALPDNTGLVKTNSERVLKSKERYEMNQQPATAFTISPAANRVKCPFMTLSPPKCLTSTQRKPALDPTSAKWSQAVRIATKARREKEQQQLEQMSKMNYSTVGGTTNLMKLASHGSMKLDKRRVFYDAEMHYQAAINPDPFAATTTHDPFLSATMYLDERATDKYEKQFKNWLNALVTVPVDMDSDQGSHVLDVGKVFNEVRHEKKETVPQTKESVSCKYFTKYRMPLLRRAAVELYTSQKIVVPLSKLDVQIEKKLIEMRSDRNLHADLSLQRNILELLLCFNTLWLRIGLEVVFGEEIPLTSNADVYGLTSFVLNRLFRDKYLEKKYGKASAFNAKYAEQVKKAALRRLFHLIVFLDAAKEERLIKHNPCLFTRASPHKETKEIMVKFASHLLANVGDITRLVKKIGIILVHKQTYLDEFDFAFTNLAVDLRDGIRLTKVMEIILLRDNLTRLLRYPAVSRLQKIHNVDVGLKALQEADYQIHGDIVPKDIVEGHREKTLSLLWQLIYKFRAPKFNAAANVVQRWWRVRMLQREVDARIQTKRLRRMHDAAVVIQRNYRGYSCRKAIPEYFRERTIATVVMQTYLRGYMARKRYLEVRRATIVVQKWWRRNKDMHAQRKRFVELREATLTVQQRWRANKLTKIQSEKFNELRQATVLVQRRFRANLKRKQAMQQFVQLKQMTIFVQRKFRANQRMKMERRTFLQLKQATITIQRRFRDFKLMQRIQLNFVKVQYSSMVIQRYFRGYLAMKRERKTFEQLKQAARVVQRRFRANIEMRRVRDQYLKLKGAVALVENRYRANFLAKSQKMSYLRLKWAAVAVQRQYRATLAMRSALVEYHHTREQIIKIQRYFRGYLEMKRCVNRFNELKWAVNVVHVRFQAKQVMIKTRTEFVQTKVAIVRIQHWVRANKARDECRKNYQKSLQLIVQMQRRWRAKLQGRVIRGQYEKMKQATIVIQRVFRATQLMEVDQRLFQEKRRAAVVLQRKWRAMQMGRLVKRQFSHQRQAILVIQRRFRANILMKRTRNEFLRLKEATVSLQTRWRARMAMRVAVAEYQQLRRYTVIVQSQWRAVLTMREERTRYQEIRRSAIEIQKHVRGFLVRQEMERRRKATLVLQMYYRLWVERRRCQGEYQRLKQAAVVVQRQWRRRCEMNRIRAEYLYQRELIVMVQRKFRAQRAMRLERQQFLVIKSAVAVLQQRLKAVLVGRQTRQAMEQRKRVVIRMQSLCRGVLARAAYRKLWYEKMSPEAIELRKKNAAASKIQQLWRGYRVRRKHQTKAMREIGEKIKASRKMKPQDRVTVKIFLGASMVKLNLGLGLIDATKIFKSLGEYENSSLIIINNSNCHLITFRFLFTGCSSCAGGQLCASGQVLLYHVIAGDQVGAAQIPDRAVLSCGAEFGAVRRDQETNIPLRVFGDDRADLVAVGGQGVSYFQHPLHVDLHFHSDTESQEGEWLREGRESEENNIDKTYLCRLSTTT